MFVRRRRKNSAAKCRYLAAMREPPNEFERIAEASRLAEVERNRKSPTTRLQGVFFALLFGTAGAVMLRLGRFTEGYTGAWWVFMLVGMVCGALGYIVVRWGREAEKQGCEG